jgi:starvation-inducible DNA-binding protein
MIPKIGISDTNLKKSSNLLTVVLSDEMTLYIKTRKFHWNVAGESFMELHKLFESQYTALEIVIDEVAERINKLGEKKQNHKL